MSKSFILPGCETVCLDGIADQLRAQITALPAGAPKMARWTLATQSSAAELLVVVRDQEQFHAYPNSDLILSVLEGGGHVQLQNEVVQAPVGTTVVFPKGMCHSYHNTAKSDSVLLVTFCPTFSESVPCTLT
jgi:oxalate decarboxylase/phosphoglucose isomerase-like protein (cupin superfamily)